MNMLPYLALKALFDKLLMRPFGAARFILKGCGGAFISNVCATCQKECVIVPGYLI